MWANKNYDFWASKFEENRRMWTWQKTFRILFQTVSRQKAEVLFQFCSLAWPQLLEYSSKTKQFSTYCQLEKGKSFHLYIFEKGRGAACGDVADIEMDVMRPRFVLHFGLFMPMSAFQQSQHPSCPRQCHRFFVLQFYNEKHWIKPAGINQFRWARWSTCKISWLT